MRAARVVVVAALALAAPAPSWGQAGEVTGAITPDIYLLPEGDAFSLYDRGFGALRRGDWDAAEQSFSTLLERFPNDELAPNARYWLAETYLQRGDAARAAQAFQQVYRSAPHAVRAPDAMYKESVARQRAGDHYGACLIYRELQKSYPLDAARYPADPTC